MVMRAPGSEEARALDSKIGGPSRYRSGVLNPR